MALSQMGQVLVADERRSSAAQVSHIWCSSGQTIMGGYETSRQTKQRRCSGSVPAKRSTPRPITDTSGREGGRRDLGSGVESVE